MAPPSHFYTNNGAPQNGAVVPAGAGNVPPQHSCLLDPNEFRRQGHQVIDFIADYYARMDDYPVHPSVNPGFLHAPPAPRERTVASGV